MQQRAALARALVLEPEVLLMDEPFAALDAQMREKMQDLLLELQRSLGQTILFVTHDIEEALRIAAQVVVLSPRPGRAAGYHTAATRNGRRGAQRLPQPHPAPRWQADKPHP